MSQINLKSITGITSITTPTGVDNQLTLHNNNTTEAVKLDTAGNLHFHNHLNITGVSTAANFKTGTSNLHNTGLNVFDLDVDGHTNLDNVNIVGIVTISAGTNNEGLRITGQNNNAVIFTSPSINGSAGYRLNHHPATNTLRVDTTDQNGTYTGIVASFSSAGLDMADNIKLRLGTSQDLTLYHYQNNAYIDNATGSILFRQGGSEKLRITSNGSFGFNNNNPQYTLDIVGNQINLQSNASASNAVVR